MEPARPVEWSINGNLEVGHFHAWTTFQAMTEDGRRYRALAAVVEDESGMIRQITPESYLIKFLDRK